MNITPGAFDVPDTAAYIGMEGGHAYVWALIAAGLLEVQRKGKRTTVLRHSADALLARGDLPSRKELMELAAMKKAGDLPSLPTK